MQVETQPLLAHYGASQEEFESLLTDSCEKVLAYVSLRCQQMREQAAPIQYPPGSYFSQLPLNVLTGALISCVIFQLHSQAAYNNKLLSLFPSESRMLSVAEEATWLATRACLSQLEALVPREPSWLSTLLADDESVPATLDAGPESSLH